jgi:hypothetical protein
MVFLFPSTKKQFKILIKILVIAVFSVLIVIILILEASGRSSKACASGLTLGGSKSDKEEEATTAYWGLRQVLSHTFPQGALLKDISDYADASPLQCFLRFPALSHYRRNQQMDQTR